MIHSSILRWSARLLSLASLWLLILFASNPANAPTTQEIVALAFFPMGMLVGFGISWWRERLGSYISLGSLACFYTWMLFTRGYMPSGQYFAIFALPAILFLLANRSADTQSA